MKTIKNNLLLPSPVNINWWWNLGSLLMFMLAFQIITGLLLSFHYTPHILLAFESLNYITKDIAGGWMLQSFHANGASFFFIFIYTHMIRGLYYKSAFFLHVWTSGGALLIILMGTAFLGYVLPWGQMSYWGATVITNLMSSLPYIGRMLVEWVWGSFAVSNATLNRFYSLHFILPFLLIVLVFIHLFFLHESGSSDPMGLDSNFSKVPFHPLFTLKDLSGVFMLFIPLLVVTSFFPALFTEADNFIEANPLVAPPHIKPEWYFLWAYALLRSVPNKLGGVITMVLAILFIMYGPLMCNSFMPFSVVPQKSGFFYPLLSTFFLLSWIGGRPVEYPFFNIGLVLTFMYFILFSFFLLS